MDAISRSSDVSDQSQTVEHPQHFASTRTLFEGRRGHGDGALGDDGAVSPISTNVPGPDFASFKQPRPQGMKTHPFQEIKGYKPLSPPRSTSLRRARNPSSPFCRLSDGWTLEILSFIGSLGALLAIVGILVRYNGRPGPEWPDHVAINSVILWFTALMKAMLFVPTAACISQASWNRYHGKARPLKEAAISDSASRGPLGSLRLLSHFGFM